MARGHSPRYTVTTMAAGRNRGQSGNLSRRSRLWLTGRGHHGCLTACSSRGSRARGLVEGLLDREGWLGEEDVHAARDEGGELEEGRVAGELARMARLVRPCCACMCVVLRRQSSQASMRQRGNKVCRKVNKVSR